MNYILSKLYLLIKCDTNYYYICDKCESQNLCKLFNLFRK